jgi:hypothetical protein
MHNATLEELQLQHQQVFDILITWSYHEIRSKVSHISEYVNVCNSGISSLLLPT